MLQFKNGYYRVHILSRLRITSAPISTSRVVSFSINRDALGSANSTFVIEAVPNNCNEGDILLMVDPYGTKLYTGIIEQISNKTIECKQPIELFNDDWWWKFENKDTIEETVKGIIEQNFKYSNDPMIYGLFRPFDVVVESSTYLKLPKQELDYVTNFADFLYSLFDDYGIIVDFYIPFNDEKPKIIIKKDDNQLIKMGDNTFYTPIMTPTTEIYETNKLVVYYPKEEPTEDEPQYTPLAYRGTWYGSDNGITNDPNELTRLTKVNTNIVFSADDISIIKAQNLRSNMYNHKIEVSLILNNKLYDFNSFTLGQEFQIWINGKFYSTILTGWGMEKEDNKEVETVNLIFGKVRTKMSQKWSDV